VIKNTKTDVKLLGNGELTKKLTVRVHVISATARKKIEGAGGTVSLLREPKVKIKRQGSGPKGPDPGPDPELAPAPTSEEE